MKYRAFGALGLGVVLACASTATTEEEPTEPAEGNPSSASSSSSGTAMGAGSSSSGAGMSTSSSSSSTSSTSSSSASSSSGAIVPGDAGTDSGVPTLAPTITSIGPVQGGAAGATRVTITGTNFVGTPVRVKFGSALGVFVSATPTTIVALSPSSSTVGAVDVTVDWTSGRLVTEPLGFRYVWSVIGFRSRVAYASGGTSVESIALGDFNRDGKLDFVAGVFDGDAKLHLGNGDGTFSQAANVAMGGSGRVVAADFNGDGKLDLASTWLGSGVVRVALGNGAGGFDAARSNTVAAGPIGLSAGDLNGDGKLDLVASCINGNVTSVLLGNGDGTFLPATNLTGGGDYANAVADMNGDGKLDIVVTSLQAPRVMVFFGNGNGTFAPYVSITTPNVPIGLAVGDLNGDGRPDVMATRQNGSDVYVAVNSGAGAFAAVQTKNIAGATSIKGITLGDMDADGKIDAIFGGTSGKAYVLRGLGDGTFNAPLSFFSSAGNAETHGFAVADFNNDTRPDFVMSSASNSHVYVGDQN